MQLSTSRRLFRPLHLLDQVLEVRHELVEVLGECADFVGGADRDPLGQVGPLRGVLRLAASGTCLLQLRVELVGPLRDPGNQLDPGHGEDGQGLRVGQGSQPEGDLGDDESYELPHYADPPTGQVPTVVLSESDEQAEAEIKRLREAVDRFQDACERHGIDVDEDGYEII